jgi:hypothetical protein
MAIKANASFEIRGTKQVNRNLQEYADRFPEAAAVALFDQMHEIVEPDVYESTPEKSGDLRGTIQTESSVQNGKIVSCSIVAGGDNAPYAWIVHEDLDAFHPVGSAKYIERPLNRASRSFGQELGARLQVDKVMP